MNMTNSPNLVEAPRWNDVWATDLVVPSGATAPDRATIPGATNLDAWAFDGNATTESLGSSFEIPHDYEEGTDLRPHLHWAGSSAGAGNVKWNFTYTLIVPGAEATAEATLTFTAANPGLGANSRPIGAATEFPVISGTGLKIGTIIRFRLFRNPGDAADTYADDALLFQAGIHYELDALGSRQVFTK